MDGERLVVPVLLGAQDVDVGVDPRLRHEEPGSRGGRGGSAWTREGEEGGRERRYDDGSRGGGLGDAGRQAVPRGRTDHAAPIAGGEAGRARVSAGGSGEGEEGGGGDESLVGLCLISVAAFGYRTGGLAGAGICLAFRRYRLFSSGMDYCSFFVFI